MNDLAVAGALATAPSSAFAELRERPRFWAPLVLLSLATAAIVAWYYAVVDIDWLKDLLFGNNPDFQKMPAEARASAMNFVGRKTLMLSGVLGGLMGVPFILLVSALYFMLAANVTKLPIRGLNHWFSFAAWASLPGLLSTAAGAMFLLLRDNDQIPPSALQPLSLNELIFHIPFGAKGQALLDSLNVPGFLSWALMIIGVHTWSQRSWLFSSVVTLLPVVLVYGIWSAFVFR